MLQAKILIPYCFNRGSVRTEYVIEKTPKTGIPVASCMRLACWRHVSDWLVGDDCTFFMGSSECHVSTITHKSAIRRQHESKGWLWNPVFDTKRWTTKREGREREGSFGVIQTAKDASNDCLAQQVSAHTHILSTLACPVLAESLFFSSLFYKQ